MLQICGKSCQNSLNMNYNAKNYQQLTFKALNSELKY
jgi:hypothetical protein